MNIRKSRKQEILLQILINILLVSLLWGQQKADSGNVIIDKKFTITFEEMIRLKKFTKTPELKAVTVNPSENPVVYDKQAFYQSLKIKHRKTPKEIFNYPLFGASLSGGKDNFAAGLFFQADGKKITPHLSWDFKQNSAEHSNSTVTAMNFSGGAGLHINEKLSYTLNLTHRLYNGEDYNLLPDSIAKNFSASLMNIDMKADYRSGPFNFTVGTSYRDLSHRYEDEFTFGQTSLFYDAARQYTKWAIVSYANASFYGNELSGNNNTFSLFKGFWGGKYYGDLFSVTAGFGLLNRTATVYDGERSYVYPELSCSYTPMPGRLALSGGYDRSFDNRDTEHPARENLYVAPRQISPDLVKNHWYASADLYPADKLRLNLGINYRDYAYFGRLNKTGDDNLYGYYYISTDTATVKITAFTLGISRQNEHLKIFGVVSYEFRNITANAEPFLTSPVSLYGNVSYYRGKSRLMANLRYSGTRKTVAGEKSGESFTLISLAVYHEFLHGTEGFMFVKNLLNTKYELIPGFTQPGAETGIGIKYKW